MHAAPYLTSENGSRVFSPVTLNHEWPTLGRLILMVVCSFLGTMINGFFVASFFVEHTLKRMGNVYLACMGLSDMILTTAVLPVSAVVLLSGEWDILPVCHALQFLTEASTYCYSLFFIFISIETYYRICRSNEEYDAFLSLRVGYVATAIFVTGFLVAGVGVYSNLDYDYCERKHYGNFIFRCSTIVIFYIIPLIVIMYRLISASIRVRRRAREQVHYRRSQLYLRDSSTTNLNILAYLLYVVSWAPYLYFVNDDPNVPDYVFYLAAWAGVGRAVFSNFLYTALNRNFRRAFSRLFYYCCCKSSLTSSYNIRHRREYKFPSAEVRVHIMHQAVNVNSPQRAASSSRETQDL